MIICDGQSSIRDIKITDEKTKKNQNSYQRLRSPSQNVGEKKLEKNGCIYPTKSDTLHSDTNKTVLTVN